MKSSSTYSPSYIILIIILIIVFLANIASGSVAIPFKDVIASISGLEVSKESWSYIVINYRLPKAFTAVLTGAGLSASGLLMQTLFRNPLAGPFVLGISSGASLGVAVLILGSFLFWGSSTVIVGDLSLVIAASMGSFLVLIIVMAVATKIRDTMAILIIGLMLGSMTTAVVSVLSYFSSSEKLQQYVFWTFGSLGNLNWNSLLIFALVFTIGLLMSVFLLKALNSLLLGENYARSMGLNIKKSRYLIIVATCLLAGSVTAFAGPIAFIGLAVPHLTRQIFNTTNHRVLLPAVMLYGAIIMLFCDIIAQLPNSEYTLPINAITSLIGAPVVIWLLIRKRKMIF